MTGFHHDLRPKNILVSGEKFILADFGLSRFKHATENSETSFKIGEGDYIAPECEDIMGNFEKFRVHRSSDVWAFGCILMEVLIYMAFGVSGVSDFRQARKFRVTAPTGGTRTFSLFHCGSLLNPRTLAQEPDLYSTNGKRPSYSINTYARQSLFLSRIFSCLSIASRFLKSMKLSQH